ncbi:MULTISPECIES: class F sortase [unclassified Ornithinimicrobium]|uniref:class F sortase n=1 Tax=unclassified Ornithinimicrobium TaxID=2615080 RepID=UPI0038541789
MRLPAIDVTSALHPLGLAADGTLEVPTGALVDQAAWYSGSPTPGEVGPTVVEGHVTGPGGRPSVFFDLGATTVGDRVEVDREDGRTVVYEVYRVDRFAKDAFPTVDVYGATPGPELRVITCGGEFDEGSGHHVDNTVVFARQVSIEG